MTPSSVTNEPTVSFMACSPQDWLEGHPALYIGRTEDAEIDTSSGEAPCLGLDLGTRGSGPGLGTRACLGTRGSGLGTPIGARRAEARSAKAGQRRLKNWT